MKSILSSCASILLVLLLASCASQKTVNYLSYYPQDSSHTYIYQGYEVPFQPGDQLNISVSALNPAAALPYNLINGGKGVSVEQDGRILFPQLGYIRVAGLTKTQLRDLLLTRLRAYLTDPVVSVDLLNFKVTVMGEVGRPGPISQPEGKLNILEAIAMAGDITTYGKKYPVRIIRENNGRREFGYVNLLSHSIFSSPYYRLQQNDIIFVEAMENKPTASQEVTQRRIGFYSTLLGIATTLYFLVFNVLLKK